MREEASIAVIIPALNEEPSIGKVLDSIPDWVDDVVVADNGSSDGTREVARAHGARVVLEKRRGYGSACLKGIAALQDSDVVVFLDADLSDYPEEMRLLVDPILNGEADLAIGSRVRGTREPGSLTPQARFGNWLACRLIKIFWNKTFTDLGPFRAIRWDTLSHLEMRDPDYGWTVEMQVKAARQGVRTLEVPVSYRRRIGRSKVSGTLRGVIGAGTKILGTLFLSALQSRTRTLRDQLSVFTRFPEAGKAKTRLIPSIGAEAAAQLQREMTEHTLAVVRDYSQSSRVAVEVRHEGGKWKAMREWLGEDCSFRPQGNGDLGERMQRTFRTAFEAGVRSAVIIGTDCPELGPHPLHEAFASLEYSDLVLGPARDGGYYLIGLRSSVPEETYSRLFSGMPWGSGEVLSMTLAQTAESGLKVKQLAILADVDRPEDLALWEGIQSTKTRPGRPDTPSTENA